MKNAIVTGAGGFIGSNLVKFLVSNNVEVTAVVRNESSVADLLADLNGVEIICCGLEEMTSLPSKIRKRNFDVFYHLAWAGNSGAGRHDYNMQMKNVVGAADALKASEALECSKFLAVGTITERVAANILNFPDIFAQNLIYGIAKNTAHQVCEFLSRKSPVVFTWCQLSNIYGPGNRTGNIVSYTLETIMNGKIPEFSSALQPFDLMHVEDCVCALYLLGASAEKIKECFIGSGRPKILKEYLLYIGQAAGVDISAGIGKRPDDGIVYDESWFDICGLVAATGFVPRIGFEEGVSRTIETMKNTEVK